MCSLTESTLAGEAAALGDIGDGGRLRRARMPPPHDDTCSSNSEVIQTARACRLRRRLPAREQQSAGWRSGPTATASRTTRTWPSPGSELKGMGARRRAPLDAEQIESAGSDYTPMIGRARSRPRPRTSSRASTPLPSTQGPVPKEPPWGDQAARAASTRAPADGGPRPKVGAARCERSEGRRHVPMSPSRTRTYKLSPN
jgi:hypothetical protein